MRYIKPEAQPYIAKRRQRHLPAHSQGDKLQSTTITTTTTTWDTLSLLLPPPKGLLDFLLPYRKNWTRHVTASFAVVAMWYLCGYLAHYIPDIFLYTIYRIYIYIYTNNAAHSMRGGAGQGREKKLLWPVWAKAPVFIWRRRAQLDTTAAGGRKSSWKKSGGREEG